MKKTKLEKGITLVALIITIVVLLILAVVSIGAVRNSGIIGHATNTSDTWKQAKDNEVSDLASYEAKLDKYASKDSEIDWETIINSLGANYDEYLAKAQALGQNEDINIGIGTDGNIVNLDLWHYGKTDDGNSLSLGTRTSETSNCIGAYKTENIVNGQIQGKMPQYIYVKTDEKVYAVTTIKCMFGWYKEGTETIPDIPSTVTSIGWCAFSDSNIKSITIPESVVEIEERAFEDCENLEKVVFNNGVKIIGEDAFCGCISMEQIVLPETLEEIGDLAFEYCIRLKLVIIPASVKTIGGYAFGFEEFEGDENFAMNLSEVYFESETAPEFREGCFYKPYGEKITFYFRNANVANAFTEEYYNPEFGSKSDNYNW